MINVIKKLLDRPIAFHRPFVGITGSVNAALMLSQGMYWTNRTDDSEGWFYKTSADWELETGLSRREQDTARKYLKKTGFWHEDLRGLPATMYYRVDLEKLFMRLSKGAKLDERGKPSSGRHNRQTTLYNTETTTETTTPEPLVTGSQDASFVEGNPQQKDKAQKDKNQATETYKEFVAAWCEQYKELGFDAVAGKKIKAMIEQTRTDIVGRGQDPTLERMTGMFKYVLAYVKRDGHFVHGKPITTFASQYLSVIYEIRNGKVKPAGRKVSVFTPYRSPQ